MAAASDVGLFRRSQKELLWIEYEEIARGFEYLADMFFFSARRPSSSLIRLYGLMLSLLLRKGTAQTLHRLNLCC